MIFSTIIPEFCDLLVRGVAEKVVCRYQHIQNHYPPDAGFVNQNYNQINHVQNKLSKDNNS
jgi:hypothetical protein